MSNELIDYWDRVPCNSLRGLGADRESKRWFANIALNRYFVEPHLPVFAGFREWSGKRVLDFGCGIGTDAVNFSLGGAKVVAVDTSAASLRLARINARHFDVRIEAMEMLPAPTEKFDLVYSCGVLHHIPNAASVLRKLRGLCRGELRIMLYHKYSMKRLLRRQPEAQAGCPYIKYYTRRSARKFVEEAGFRVQRLKVLHVFPYHINAYKEGRYEKIPFVGFLQSFDWLWGEHILIKAVPCGTEVGQVSEA